MKQLKLIIPGSVKMINVPNCCERNVGNDEKKKHKFKHNILESNVKKYKHVVNTLSGIIIRK